VPDEQRNAGRLEVLGQTGMIDVIVSGEPVLDLVERDAGAPQVGAWPPSNTTSPDRPTGERNVRRPVTAGCGRDPGCAQG